MYKELFIRQMEMKLKLKQKMFLNIWI